MTSHTKQVSSSIALKNSKKNFINHPLKDSSHEWIVPLGQKATQTFLYTENTYLTICHIAIQEDAE
jgi:hypothetical protein